MKMRKLSEPDPRTVYLLAFGVQRVHKTRLKCAKDDLFVVGFFGVFVCGLFIRSSLCVHCEKSYSTVDDARAYFAVTLARRRYKEGGHFLEILYPQNGLALCTCMHICYIYMLVFGCV